MDSFVTRSLSSIPIEQAHGGTGARQVIFSRDDGLSKHLDAATKGFLEPNAQFDWHDHNVDEFFVVLEGEGKVSYRSDAGETVTESYQPGDIFYCRTGLMHKIECLGSKRSEYIFVRLDG